MRRRYSGVPILCSAVMIWPQFAVLNAFLMSRVTMAQYFIVPPFHLFPAVASFAVDTTRFMASSRIGSWRVVSRLPSSPPVCFGSSAPTACRSCPVGILVDTPRGHLVACGLGQQDKPLTFP